MKELTTVEDWNECLDESRERPVLVFKRIFLRSPQRVPRVSSWVYRVLRYGTSFCFVATGA